MRAFLLMAWLAASWLFPVVLASVVPVMAFPECRTIGCDCLLAGKLCRGKLLCNYICFGKRTKGGDAALLVHHVYGHRLGASKLGGVVLAVAAVLPGKFHILCEDEQIIGAGCDGLVGERMNCSSWMRKIVGSRERERE